MNINDQRKELLITEAKLEQDLQKSYDDFVVYCKIKSGNYTIEKAVEKLDKYINYRNKLKAVRNELRKLTVQSKEPSGRARKNTI